MDLVITGSDVQVKAERGHVRVEISDIDTDQLDNIETAKCISIKHFLKAFTLKDILNEFSTSDIINELTEDEIISHIDDSVILSHARKLKIETILKDLE